ncbi:hypothetical protein MIND_00400600 [Mycena indigotica]|uniref:Uncharacterized protein n=1 Tax=Mycena indigotica TaxID=2126181 RepID=A0A8H6T4K4_9AGAR|nr:uncharacterized protein MIND_00400600 [Mycena indigotica]KAF7310267.1 hypothetical protein MIND_00400600 [Mycena indigotica]
MLLRTLFCGCMGRDKEDVIPDERARLLGGMGVDAGGGGSQGVGASVVDEQKLRQTMEGIVRSASSKMVNVYARKPFTLTAIVTPLPSRPASPDIPQSARQRQPECATCHAESEPADADAPPGPSPRHRRNTYTVLTIAPAQTALRWEDAHAHAADADPLADMHPISLLAQWPPGRASRSSSLRRHARGPSCGSEFVRGAPAPPGSPLPRAGFDGVPDAEEEEDDGSDGERVALDGGVQEAGQAGQEGDLGCVCRETQQTPPMEEDANALRLVYSWPRDTAE